MIKKIVYSLPGSRTYVKNSETRASNYELLK